jgi:hypothetical protein
VARRMFFTVLVFQNGLLPLLLATSVATVALIIDGLRRSRALLQERYEFRVPSVCHQAAALL